MSEQGVTDVVVRPSFARLAWLWWHQRRNPSHVLVGWSGDLLRCGTCLRLAKPENGLPKRLIPRHHIRERHAVSE